MAYNAVTNIIEFPIERRKKQINKKKMESEGFSVKLYSGSLEELEQTCEYEPHADALMENLLSDMYEMGFDVQVQCDENAFDISLAFETIRSLLFKFSGNYHPLQNFAESIYAECVNNFENDKQLEFDF